MGVCSCVWLCVPVCSCVCVCVQKSIRINLYPQLFEAPHRPVVPVSPSVCVCVCLPPCYLVVAVLVGPFGHRVWVSLVKV